MIRTKVISMVLATVLIVISGEGMAVAASDIMNDRGEDVLTRSLLFLPDIGRENKQRTNLGTAALPTARVAMQTTLSRQPRTFENIGMTGLETAMAPNDYNPLLVPLPEQRRSVDNGLRAVFRSNPAAIETSEWSSIKERAADDVKPLLQLAQFQLPKPSADGKAPVKKLQKRLTYQYGYGSESEISYSRNPDLNTHSRDDFLIMTPEINSTFTYRPTDWLETTVEMILEREIPLHEHHTITLPDGEIQRAKNRKFSLIIDQAFVTIKDFTGPFQISLGRRNSEDDRHWLYDTSMDIASLELKLGKFKAEALVGREVLKHLDLLQKESTDQINTYWLRVNYRGIENIKLACYAVARHDHEHEEGRPILMGVRSQGHPTNTFSYWANLAFMRGRDELSHDFSGGYAYDVGVTYRFLGLPYRPNVTLGYAFATGDDKPDDKHNNEFRQTGLQSNEAWFAGISEFKTYGEALDPELSNLKILTAGLGFRPAPNISLDLVYHHYRLDEIAEEIRNAEITAEMNQVDTRPSKDVGDGFDVVLGCRSLFGVRRLGLDLRMGWFFPGDAFRRDDRVEDEDSPIFKDADKGFSIVAKIWW